MNWDSESQLWLWHWGRCKKPAWSQLQTPPVPPLRRSFDSFSYGSVTNSHLQESTNMWRKLFLHGMHVPAPVPCQVLPWILLPLQWGWEETPRLLPQPPSSFSFYRSALKLTSTQIKPCQDLLYLLGSTRYMGERFHLQNHPVKSSLTSSPLSNWHRAQIYHP